VCRQIISMSDKLKERNILKLILIMRFTSATLDVGHPIVIHQLTLNSLYSILHISESKPMRNGKWAPWSSVVWLFEISKMWQGKMLLLCSRTQWHSMCIQAMSFLC
jgi:hypothetical protein